MPAEWERHEASWLAFPHNAADWPGKFGPIPWAYAEIVRWASEGETVRLVVKDLAHEKGARRVLEKSHVPLDRVDFHRWPSDRGWMRDTGPIWVTRRGAKAIARFRFDAWSKYPNWKQDVKLPERAAKALGAELIPIVRGDRPVVLEGGAIDVNGAGTILTTEECMLDPAVQVRNPGFGREDYEAVFREALGAPNTIWLGKGIAGDDTHGHVDDLARFVGPRTIVLVREDDPKDANYAPLEENRERLQGARLQDGGKPEVVYLPMPAPLLFDGTRLPASYANFYVANAAVLVPTFDDPADREALGILGELFTDRPVVGIHARDLVWGLGTIHCLSQQEPVAPVLTER
jgi:agmatine deiminase